MAKFHPGLVLTTAVAAASAWEHGRIGDLTYDAAEWDVQQEGDAYRVRLHYRDQGDSLRITVGSGHITECSAESLARSTEHFYDRSVKTIHRPEFTIHVVSAGLGCRNARPPSILACAAYRGRVCRFDSPVLTCRGGPGFGSGAVDFLEQLGVP